jgi:hypothetical protein
LSKARGFSDSADKKSRSKRDIILKGRKRGSWQRDASISSYVRHLRAEAAGHGGEAGSAGAAQAILAEGKLKAFRNRVLAIPHRVDYLSARQTLALTQELRTCLDELNIDAT